ncbi:hypothetical protein GINT2_000886 [Glugoides intestinalis]
MDKRQRLKVTTPDASSLLQRENTIVDFTRDSSIVISPKVTIPYKTESIDFEPFSSFEVDKNKNANCFISKCNGAFDSLINCGRAYWIHTIFIAIIIFLITRPSEYKLLLEELEKLKQERQVVTHPAMNIAELIYGTKVVDHSELYMFGFLKSTCTDPNAILEPGESHLALLGSEGFFELHFQEISSLKKIAIYHPETRNPKSAIKNFTVVGNDDKSFDFTFCGKGYVEFYLDDVKTDKLKIIFHNNHGEPLYTCVYRIFIFAGNN